MNIDQAWLLERVLIHGWTTVKIAKELGAQPNEVLDDFNEACIKAEYSQYSKYPVCYPRGRRL